MKVKIDADLCTGCEDCVNALPAIFAMNDDGIAIVKVETVPAESEEETKRVVDECQGAAMEIEE